MLMPFEAARQLLTEPYACFKLVTAAKHLALLPKFIGSFTSGILAQLNSELKFYSNELDGVLIAFSNVKRLQRTGQLIEHHPHIHLDIQADFIIFQPCIGAILKGIVNKMGKDHIGVLVHHCFNGSIPKPREAESGGSWPADVITLGQEVMFKVTKLYTHAGVVSMQGRLTEESIAQIAQKKRAKRKAEEAPITLSPVTPSSSQPKKKKKRKDQHSPTNASQDSILASSAFTSSEVMDISQVDIDTPDESVDVSITQKTSSNKKKKKKIKQEPWDTGTPAPRLLSVSQSLFKNATTSTPLGMKSKDVPTLLSNKEKKKKKKAEDSESALHSISSTSVLSTPVGADASSPKKARRKKQRGSELGESILSHNSLGSSLGYQTPGSVKTERDTASIGSNDSGVGLATPGNGSDKDSSKNKSKKKKKKTLQKDEKDNFCVSVSQQGTQNIITKEENGESGLKQNILTTAGQSAEKDNTSVVKCDMTVKKEVKLEIDDKSIDTSGSKTKKPKKHKKEKHKSE